MSVVVHVRVFTCTRSAVDMKGRACGVCDSGPASMHSFQCVVSYSEVFVTCSDCPVGTVVCRRLTL